MTVVLDDVLQLFRPDQPPCILHYAAQHHMYTNLLSDFWENVSIRRVSVQSPAYLSPACCLFPVPCVPCVNPCSSITAPDVPHPHPAAPLEFKQSFSEFVARREAAAHSSPSPSASAAPADSKKGSNNDTVTYHDFWEAPNRLWQRTYSEQEMNAIMVSTDVSVEMIILIVGQSGGASNY